jgi:hypothetical protein
MKAPVPIPPTGMPRLVRLAGRAVVPTGGTDPVAPGG